MTDVGIAVVVEIAKIDAHAGDVDAVFAQGDILVEAGFFELSAAFVAEKGIHQLVVGDDQVHAAGEFGVGRGYAHAFAGMRAESGFFRGIAKGPVAFVDEQLVRRRLVHLGMAVVVMTVTFADGLVIEIPLQIVDDDEVEQAVVVDVDPGGGDGPERAVLGVGLVEAGFGGDVGESSVAVVVIERVAVDAGDEDVFVAVVVVVADGDADVDSQCLLGRLFR